MEPEILTYTAPTTLSTNVDLWKNCTREHQAKLARDECSICLDAMTLSNKIDDDHRAIQLDVCGHCFHQGCIHQALQTRPACPTCRQPVGTPQGYMPSGTMTISSTPDCCDGFAEVNGSIEIRYDISRDIQKPYHGNPGVGHGSAHRTAYLPNNDDGQQLLKRLKFAFVHGLTFTVGVSMSNGQDNQVTWASIHHKTSLYGGVYSHGFPDPSFFLNCNEELDFLNVPHAVDL